VLFHLQYVEPELSEWVSMGLEVETEKGKIVVTT